MARPGVVAAKADFLADQLAVAATRPWPSLAPAEPELLKELSWILEQVLRAYRSGSIDLEQGARLMHAIGAQNYSEEPGFLDQRRRALVGLFVDAALSQRAVQRQSGTRRARTGRALQCVAGYLVEAYVQGGSKREHAAIKVGRILRSFGILDKSFEDETVLRWHRVYLKATERSRARGRPKKTAS